MDEDKEIKTEPQPITLSITLNPDGRIGVQGPIQNGPLCLWLLEMGKLTVIQTNMAPPKIIKPQGSIMDFARKRFA